MLRKKALIVKKFTPELKDLAHNMLKVMENHKGIGLAANQVGSLKRLFIAKFNDKIYAVVNPVIVPLTLTTVSIEEGCLSIPEVWLNIERHENVLLKGYDLDGNPLEMKLTGIEARVAQHETDHLDGVLIIDKIGLEDREKIKEKLVEIEKEEKKLTNG